MQLFLVRGLLAIAWAIVFVAASDSVTTDLTFGHKGTVDMVLLIGLYAATCALLNTFEVPAEASQQ